MKEILVLVATVNVLEQHAAPKQEQTKTFQWLSCLPSLNVDTRGSNLLKDRLLIYFCLNGQIIIFYLT
jgi:hypothetical protein